MSRKQKLATVGDALEATAAEILKENPQAEGEAKGKIIQFNQNLLTDEAIERVREGAIEELAQLIRKRWPTIWKNYSAGYQAWAEDNPETDRVFTFPLKTAVTLCPQGKAMSMVAAVAYGIRRKHSSDGRSVQLVLDL